MKAEERGGANDIYLIGTANTTLVFGSVHSVDEEMIELYEEVLR